MTWWVPEPLDLEAMSRAAAAFVGRHDFAALAKRPQDAESTVVEIENCELWSGTGVVVLRVVGSHFLWGQVRRMVGALVAVGRGEADAAAVPRWLARSEVPPATPAPAAGLFLEAVRYPGEAWTLPPPLPIGVPWSGGPLLRSGGC